MLRAKGVVKYMRTDGSIEILMGPPAPPKQAKDERDPRAGKRAHYMNLLGRTSMPDAELDLLPDAV